MRKLWLSAAARRRTHASLAQTRKQALSQACGAADVQLQQALSRPEPLCCRREGAKGPETAGKIFDPLRLAEMGGEETLSFFRHAELKHGRVAMAAITGYLFHINHIHFGGDLSPTAGVTFEQLSALPAFEAWNVVPLLGKIQILGTIAGLEHASESLNPAGHYMKGGTPGDVKFLVRCP